MKKTGTLALALGTLALLSAPTAALRPVVDENAVVIYQPLVIDSQTDCTSDMKKRFAGARMVIMVWQGNETREAETVKCIHSVGAKAFHYANFFWYPVNRSVNTGTPEAPVWVEDTNNPRTYQNVNLQDHKDWAFCTSGSTPAVGRVTNITREDTDVDGEGSAPTEVIVAGETDWYYADLNEQGMRNQAATFLTDIASWGYDGVFMDRGQVAFTQSGLWDVQSTCTGTQVISGRKFSDAFYGMIAQAYARELSVIINYRITPPMGTVNAPRLRPDPSVTACHARTWSTCTYLNDAWSKVDAILSEYASSAKDDRTVDANGLVLDWEADEQIAASNETDALHGREVLVYLKDRYYTHPGTPIGLPYDSSETGNSTTVSDTTRRDRAFFKWARAKLHDLPVAINAGDDSCADNPNAHKECSRWGWVYNAAGAASPWEYLNTANLGSVISTAGPTTAACESGSTVRCLYIRKYRWGMVMVNPTSSSKTSGAQTLSLSGSVCRYIKTARTQGTLFSNTCVTSINASIAAYQGQVYLYNDVAW